MSRIIPAITTFIALFIFSSATGTVHEIMVGETFQPTGTTTAPGDTIRWILESGNHQIVSDPSSTKVFTSPEMSTVGETFEIIIHFADGQDPFPYHCGDHPNIVDTIFPSTACHITGDFNGNGTGYEIADAVLMSHLLFYGGAPPDHAYDGDMNADCVIDNSDLELLIRVVQGDTLPPDSSTLTCCYPTLSYLGACCFVDSCAEMSQNDCASQGGTFAGIGTTCQSSPCPCCVLRGDATHDGTVDVADLICLIENLFCFGPSCCELVCTDEADVNGDGGLDIADLVFLVEYMFVPGVAAPAPCQ